MYNLISFSHVAQVTLLRMLFAVVGVFVAAHSAKCEEGSFAPAPKLDILTIQPVYLESNWRIFYRLNTNTMFAPMESAVPGKSGFNYIPRLNLSIVQNETDWSAKARQQITVNSGHISLSPILHFESKDVQLDIRLRRQSLFAVWRKAFP